MKQLFALICVLALFSGAAFAGGMTFTEVDTDKNGTVTMEEVKASGIDEAAAAAADANEDGSLDEAEFAALEATP